MRELSRGPGIHNQYEVSAPWPNIFFMVLCKYQMVSGFSYFKVFHIMAQSFVFVTCVHQVLLMLES